MVFNDAWDRRVVEVNRTLTDKKNIEAILYFDGGTASMVMPGYFKDEDYAKINLGRAWETYCKDKPWVVNNIIEIQIIDNKVNKPKIGRIA